MVLNTCLKNKLVDFQQRNPNIYIGGSVSLILQDALPYRIPHDINIITTQKIHIYNIFSIDKTPHFRVNKCQYDGLIYNLFYNPNAQYIEYNFNGNTLKLSPIDEIMAWKIKTINKHGVSQKIYKKHLSDLKYDQVNRHT